MKVILYQKQTKFTVNNISIPNMDQLTKILKGEESAQVDIKNLQSYNFRITSTRGLASSDQSGDEELDREIEEGINWREETIN